MDTGFNLSDNKRINSEFGRRIIIKNNYPVSSNETHGLDTAEAISGKTNGKNKDVQIEIFNISKNENGHTAPYLTPDIYGNFDFTHILGKYSDGEIETNSFVFSHLFSTDTKISDFTENDYTAKIGQELQEYYEEQTDNENKNLYT
ncbi:MAG: hypothetical protein Q4D53_08330 [Leptotrichiaceae bacterium]|nr:hypothetical protein [Leptotrichiaceae bacterium]